jgi:hypothetical protein
MKELVAFLRARYAEVGRAAYLLGDAEWTASGADVHVLADPMPGEPAARASREDIARWIADRDPRGAQRALAGRRAIVDMAAQQDGYHLADGEFDGRDEEERACDEAMQIMLAEVLHHLAAEFSGHPDFRQEWSRVR